MDELRCETCRYFDPADGGPPYKRSDEEKSTWGHCRYTVPEGDTQSLGLFTWAKDVCEHMEVRGKPNPRHQRPRIIPTPSGPPRRMREEPARNDG